MTGTFIKECILRTTNNVTAIKKRDGQKIIWALLHFYLKYFWVKLDESQHLKFHVDISALFESKFKTNRGIL